MNILYYYHYIGSPTSPKEWRAYFLSKGFTANGHSVSVIGASNHHMQRDNHEQTENVVTKSIEDIQFYWLKVPKYVGNGFSRIKNMLSFGYQSFFMDPVEELGINTPDLIVASSVHPFHLIGAIRWARKYKCKIFFEVRDPWPLSLNLLLGMSKWHPLSLLLQLFQYIGHKYTDKTISTAFNLKSYMMQHGLAEDKFIYACNGIDSTQEVSEKSILDNKLSDIRDKYPRIVMYTGTLGVPNAMKYVIEAFNKIKSHNIALVIIGNGIEKENLQQLRNSKNIYFFDPVPKNEVQRVLSYADVCILSWQNISLYKYGLSPNKVFDYMWAAKPILQAVNSPNNQVELASCGENIEPENSTKIMEAILLYANKSDSELKSIGLNGHKYLLEHFEFKNIARIITDEVEIK